MEPNATKPELDAKSPIGNGVDTVEYKEGDTVNATIETADMTNADAGQINISASEENLSAKFKNPQNQQGTQVGEYSDQK